MEVAEESGPKEDLQSMCNSASELFRFHCDRLELKRHGVEYRKLYKEKKVERKNLHEEIAMLEGKKDPATPAWPISSRLGLTFKWWYSNFQGTKLDERAGMWALGKRSGHTGAGGGNAGGQGDPARSPFDAAGGGGAQHGGAQQWNEYGYTGGDSPRLHAGGGYAQGGFGDRVREHRCAYDDILQSDDEDGGSYRQGSVSSMSSQKGEGDTPYKEERFIHSTNSANSANSASSAASARPIRKPPSSAYDQSRGGQAKGEGEAKKNVAKPPPNVSKGGQYASLLKNTTQPNVVRMRSDRGNGPDNSDNNSNKSLKISGRHNSVWSERSSSSSSRSISEAVVVTPSSSRNVLVDHLLTPAEKKERDEWLLMRCRGKIGPQGLGRAETDGENDAEDFSRFFVQGKNFHPHAIGKKYWPIVCCWVDRLLTEPGASMANTNENLVPHEKFVTEEKLQFWNEINDEIANGAKNVKNWPDKKKMKIREFKTTNALFKEKHLHTMDPKRLKIFIGAIRQLPEFAWWLGRQIQRDCSQTRTKLLQTEIVKKALAERLPKREKSSVQKTKPRSRSPSRSISRRSPSRSISRRSASRSSVGGSSERKASRTSSMESSTSSSSDSSDEDGPPKKILKTDPPTKPGGASAKASAAAGANQPKKDIFLWKSMPRTESEKRQALHEDRLEENMGYRKGSELTDELRKKFSVDGKDKSAIRMVKRTRAEHIAHKLSEEERNNLEYFHKMSKRGLSYIPSARDLKEDDEEREKRKKEMINQMKKKEEAAKRRREKEKKAQTSSKKNGAQKRSAPVRKNSGSRHRQGKPETRRASKDEKPIPRNEGRKKSNTRAKKKEEPIIQENQGSPKKVEKKEDDGSDEDVEELRLE